MRVTLQDIEAAATAIEGRVVRTPMLPSPSLSALTGAEVWLKLENLQFTASFKDRGALNCLLQLSEDQRRRGVVAISASNHSQGVIKNTEIEFVLQTKDEMHVERLLAALRAEGIIADLLSNLAHSAPAP